MRKNTLAAMLFLVAAVLALVACAAPGEGAKTRQEAWLAEARLDAQETPEQLYEAALQEDTLVIYADTTRMFEVKALFEKAYPGLTVAVHDVRAADIIEMLRLADGQGASDCDIVCCSDLNAALSGTLVPAGAVYKYVPNDIAPQLRPEHNEALLEFAGEGVQLFYHSGLAEVPVSNWWQLTEPRFRGNIYMIDPRRSHTSSALLCTMIAQSDEMAAAYHALYGKPLEVPEGSTAGQEFWRMLLQNEVQFTASSDEAIEMVSFSPPDAHVLAVAVSTKIRRADVGYSIAAAFDITPRAGVFTPANIMLAAGAKNVNTAKLFIRFLLGEADGNGVGNDPYLTRGAWPTRVDVTGASEMPLSETNFWPLDKTFYAENSGWIMDWWAAARVQAEQEKEEQR